MTPSGAGRPGISALVTCYNEEHNIAACIDGLLWCDELVVVDSYSTDRTPEILRGYDKVRLLQHEYYGAAAQKNWALPQLRHDWVLIFDADERCSPALRGEIETLLASGPEAEAYRIRRNAYFLGKPIRHCGWHDDRVVRLFRRDAGTYERRRVHAKVVVRGQVGDLREPMDHFMVQDFDEYLRRIVKYGNWGAAQAWRDGKRTSLGRVVFRSGWRFVRSYLLMAGFLDGRQGLMFSLMQAYGTFVKWATVWGWQQQAASGREPRLPEFDEDEAVWQGLARGGRSGSSAERRFGGN